MSSGEVYVLIGLGLNALVTVLAVMRSKLTMENRITKMETYLAILLSRSGIHMRVGDDAQTHTEGH